LFLREDVIKSLWKHYYAWPFQQPVDTMDFNIPVSFFKIIIWLL
jgi:bromodomain-containing protein 4